VPEQNSSFPNDRLCIVDVRINERLRGELKGGYQVILSDGFFFFINAKIHKEENISPGGFLTHAGAKDLEFRSDLITAERKARFLVSRAEHSSKQIRDKLFKKGFSKRVIENVLDRFIENRLIDDRRFAEQWIFSRLRKHPEGSIVLRYGLLKRGISKKIADEVLSELITEEIAAKSIEKAGEKILRRSTDKNRLKRLLYGRGFKISEINRYIKKHY